MSIRTVAPTFPVLWGHDADRERCLIVEPDREGVVRERAEEPAAEAWGTATRLHFNLDFQLNAQSLTACLTPTSTLGGRAWPNFRMTDRRHETAAVLWANTAARPRGPDRDSASQNCADLLDARVAAMD